MTKFTKRRAARFFAVQALYQSGYTDQPLQLLLDEFCKTHLKNADHADAINADGDLFEHIVKGAQEHTIALQEQIQETLSQGWTTDRLNAVMQALLRAAAFELFYDLSMPTPVVINEYLEVAKAFFAESDVKFIHAALDSMAKRRPSLLTGDLS